MVSRWNLSLWFCLWVVFSTAITPVFSQDQSALDQVVTETFDKERLSNILNRLDRRYEISIRYNETLLPILNNDFDFQQIPLKNVLDIILDKYDLDYIEYAPNQIIIVPNSIIQTEANTKESPPIIPLQTEKVAAYDSVITLGVKSALQGPYKLSGQIMIENEWIGLSNALVLDKTTGTFTTADEEGNYQLELSEGLHEINISSISTENYNVHIDLKGNASWDINLPHKSYYVDEISISAVNKDYKITENVAGVEQISSTEIKQLNSFMGENDVLKSLTTLAGVSNIGEGASGFNVRGGTIDQNLILLDGALVYNPSHILGFFSIFNADIISTTSLYKGHMPANFGGRVASVLDINLREANLESLKVNGSLGLISSKASAEIPIIKSQSSLLVSGRGSYINWWLSNVNDLDIQRSGAQFYDANIKYTHQISSKGKLIGSYFRSYDELQFSNQFGYSWQNDIGNIQYKQFITDNSSFNIKANYSQLNNLQFIPTGSRAFNLSSGIRSIFLGAGYLKSTDKHNLRIGLDYTDINTDPEILRPRNDSQVNPQAVDKENGRELAVYINDEYSISDRLGVNIGVRWSLFNQKGPAIVNTYDDPNFFSFDNIIESNLVSSSNITSYNNIEPRISLRYRVSDNSSIKLSYNRNIQYIHLLSNTSTPTPIDIWQVSNSHIRPTVSDNFTIGLHKQTTDTWGLNIEAFYRNLNNTIDYKDFADLTLNPHLETAILKGSGRAFGAELSIDKSGEVFSGKINYTFSRSLRITDKTTIEQVNQGDWFPSNFDSPHEIKLFANLKLSKRDRFNINFVYKTGRPLTAPLGNFVTQGIVIPEFSQRNQLRLIDYHRLDISYTLRLNRLTHTRYNNEITLSLYNVYARRNPFSIFFRQELGSTINAQQLSVIGTAIPSITYNFSF